MANEFVAKNGLIVQPIQGEDDKLIYVSTSGAVTASAFSEQDLVVFQQDIQVLQTQVVEISASNVSGSGFTPLAGTGMSIVPTGEDYTFSVIDYISATEVATVSGQLETQIDENDLDIALLQTEVATVSGDLDALELVVNGINVSSGTGTNVVESPSDTWTVNVVDYISATEVANVSGNLQGQIDSIVQEGTTITSSGGTIVPTQDGLTWNLDVVDYISATEVANVSGNLQNQITTNANNIADNDSDIAGLRTDVDTVSGDLDSLESTVDAINVSSGTGTNVVESPSDTWTVNVVDYISGTEVANVSGNLQSQITSNDNDIDILNSTTISGSGVVNEIAFFSDTREIQSDSNFTFDQTNFTVGSPITTIIEGDLLSPFNGDTTNIKMGLGAAASATGTGSVLIGTNAGSNDTATGTIAVGTNAAQDNTGDRCLMFGLNAGLRNGSPDCTLIGTDAGTDNTGNRLTAVGDECGVSNSGSDVVVLGEDAGKNNTGNFVIGIGSDAARDNIGANSILIGDEGGRSNSGANSIGIGNFAIQNNSGGFVIGIGDNAGNANSGVNCIFIGKDAGASNTENYKLIISHENSSAAQVNLIEGSFENETLTLRNDVTVTGDLFDQGLSPAASGNFITWDNQSKIEDSGYGPSNIGTKYTQSFTESDMVGDILTITHNLGFQFVQVTVYDNTNQQIFPDEVTATSTTQTTLDLKSFRKPTLTGTYNVVIIG